MVLCALVTNKSYMCLQDGFPGGLGLHNFSKIFRFLILKHIQCDANVIFREVGGGCKTLYFVPVPHSNECP